NLPAAPIWVSFSSDGKLLAVHLTDGQALLLDPATGKTVRQIKCASAHGPIPWSSGRGTIGFSHDNRTLYTWGTKDFQSWDVATGKEKFLLHMTNSCWAMSEAPDGKTVAVGGYDNFIRFLDTTTGKETRPSIELRTQIIGVGYSPDGKLFFATCG